MEVIKIKTDKYNNMISAFQCDFAVAKNDSNRLLELNKLINKENLTLLKDIELLNELEWMLRTGRAEIHIK